MEYNMRHQILTALNAHALGHIEKHRLNVEIYLNSPVGIGDHSNVLEAIETELNAISVYRDQLDIIKEYFETTEPRI